MKTMNPNSNSHNRINFKTSFQDFKDKRLSFSVSSRDIHPDIDILDYLKIVYMYCDIRGIKSVFGNTFRFSRLYGGRLPGHDYDLTEIHLLRLAEQGIHMALTLTNHFFDEAAYRESWPLLEAHHGKGNSIICTNDELAMRLKQDFPLYELKASIIKNINTLDKIKRALDLYHSLTLPMDINDDDEFLNSIKEKERIILFGNANCAYTCPARTCYLGYSQEISGKPVTSFCSKNQTPRLDMGRVFFDVKKLADMGFTRFKLIPLAHKNADYACEELARKKGYPLNIIKQKKSVHYICSYPKCGRTWLRFILAHYLNRLYNLGMSLDLRSFFTLMPTDDKDLESSIHVYSYTADQRFPLLLASHNGYGVKFKKDLQTRIVLIFRAIPDVVVSEYFHRSRFMKVLNKGLKEYIRDPKGGLNRYCRYLNVWAAAVQTGRVLAFTYEMLHQDTEKTVTEVLRHFNVPVDAELLREAVTLSSFEAMQAIEKEKGMPRYQSSPDDPESQRVRKGKVGGSKEYLDGEDLEYIQCTAASLLTDAAKTLLQQHHLWEAEQR